MSSVVASVGERAGVRLGGAAGVLAASTNYVLTSVPPPLGSGGVYQQANYFYVGHKHGWAKFFFQLVVGNMTAGTVTVNATLDGPTAQGVTGATVAWEPVPAPSTEAGVQWSNPLSSTSGQRMLYVSAGPITAFQIVVSGTFNGTNSYLLFGSAP